MSIEVKSCSIVDLLSNNFQLKNLESFQITIPEYQRAYCWTEVEIKRLIDGLLQHQKETNHLPFYLGSLILHKQSNQLNVIDGQQRLTTIALFNYILENASNTELKYSSPESQQQIKHNLIWLSSHKDLIEKLNLKNITVTLVLTSTEDEAYNFFETQNTGGVRLGGPDIIKAHHLRAIDVNNKKMVNISAQRWESLGDLNPVVDGLLRGRYWKSLEFREVPMHNQDVKIRENIVQEFAENTGKGKDIAFGSIARIHDADGTESLLQKNRGYDLRQPLNAGLNTLHYLKHYEYLRRYYLSKNERLTQQLPLYSSFYNELVCDLEGCGYLKKLFDTCILMYISNFGEEYLHIAAKKLFRVVYSRRVENQKAVKEMSIPAFVRESPVLDWIETSYVPDQLFKILDNFKLKVETTGLDKNSVKKRFVDKVRDYFNLEGGSTKFGSEFSELVCSLEVGNE